MKNVLLAALGLSVLGCRQAATVDRSFEAIAPAPVRFRIVERSLDDIRDTMPLLLVPEGGSYILFEPDRAHPAAHLIRTEQLRLDIESSVATLEPGEECTVTVTLQGGAPGASYRVTLLVPDELTVRDPSIFVLVSAESRTLRVVCHARTTARILARVQRISEGAR